ncbi:MAG: hypothetical protein PHH11_11095 [Methylomonas sp.]|nr:hypothetical protein [Methylomonas sp.]
MSYQEISEEFWDLVAPLLEQFKRQTPGGSKPVEFRTLLKRVEINVVSHGYAPHIRRIGEEKTAWTPRQSSCPTQGGRTHLCMVESISGYQNPLHLQENQLFGLAPPGLRSCTHSAIRGHLSACYVPDIL